MRRPNRLTETWVRSAVKHLLVLPMQGISAPHDFDSSFTFASWVLGLGLGLDCSDLHAPTHVPPPPPTWAMHNLVCRMMLMTGRMVRRISACLLLTDAPHLPPCALLPPPALDVVSTCSQDDVDALNGC
jgi:hypothetical protein